MTASRCVRVWLVCPDDDSTGAATCMQATRVLLITSSHDSASSLKEVLKQKSLSPAAGVSTTSACCECTHNRSETWVQDRVFLSCRHHSVQQTASLVSDIKRQKHNTGLPYFNEFRAPHNFPPMLRSHHLTQLRAWLLCPQRTRSHVQGEPE